MAHLVTHGALAKEDIGIAIRDAIDEHATLPGQLLMQTAANSTIATINFTDPCNGTVAINTTTGVLTFDCSPAIADTDTSAGTATKAKFVTGAGTTAIVLECTVGIGTTFDINLSNNVFGVGDTVQITSLTYTPPA